MKTEYVIAAFQFAALSLVAWALWQFIFFLFDHIQIGWVK